MELSAFFKSLIDSDIAPVVICDTNHKIIYMNPTAAKRYSKSGGYNLIGRSLLECHNSNSNMKIKKVIEWFEQSKYNNRIFTFHNSNENKDVYMIALRDENDSLIGYYEKHEFRTPENCK